MQVRRYRSSDRTAAIGLFRQLTEAHRILYRDPSVGSQGPAATLRKHLKETRTGGSWVAVRDGRVVGLAGLVAHDDWGEAEPVVVLEGFRRKGVARLLLRTVAAEARRRRYRMLTIKPVARNATAFRTFRALGFRTVGQVEPDMRFGATARRFRPVRGPKFAGERFQA